MGATVAGHAEATGLKNWPWDHAGEPGYVPEVYAMQPSDSADAAMEMARTVGGVWILGSEPELDQTYTEPAVAAAFRPGMAYPGWRKLGRGWDHHVAERLRLAGAIPGGRRAGWRPLAHPRIRRLPTGRLTAKWQEWRAWMKSHHLVRPTIVSETAGWDAAVDQALIMDEIAEIQKSDPLLDTVLWYSDTDYWKLWPWADLRTDSSLTKLGQHYVDIHTPKELPIKP